MRIKKGDLVMISTGKNAGLKAKVIRALPAVSKVVVEGANMRKRRSRPRKSGEKGQVLELPTPLHVSNVNLYCNKCGRGVRIGMSGLGAKKIRVCKTCGTNL